MPFEGINKQSGDGPSQNTRGQKREREIQKLEEAFGSPPSKNTRSKKRHIFTEKTALEIQAKQRQVHKERLESGQIVTDRKAILSIVADKAADVLKPKHTTLERISILETIQAAGEIYQNQSENAQKNLIWHLITGKGRAYNIDWPEKTPKQMQAITQLCELNRLFLTKIFPSIKELIAREKDGSRLDDLRLGPRGFGSKIWDGSLLPKDPLSPIESRWDWNWDEVNTRIYQEDFREIIAELDKVAPSYRGELEYLRWLARTNQAWTSRAYDFVNADKTGVPPIVDDYHRFPKPEDIKVTEQKFLENSTYGAVRNSLWELFRLIRVNDEWVNLDNLLRINKKRLEDNRKWLTQQRYGDSGGPS